MAPTALCCLFVLLMTMVHAAETEGRVLNPLPHALKFEVGDAEFAAGDHIKIDSVRGSQSSLVPGQAYSVSGTYTLASQDQADLCLFVTTTSPEPTPVEPSQTMRVKKGSGTFTLAQKMIQGYPHVSFYLVPGGISFGGVYFGQGEMVLRDKKFSYFDSRSGVSGGTGSSGESTSLGSAAAPLQNRLIMEYIGNPVPAPVDLDPAYRKEGLISGVREAAKKAGITPKRIEIDDAEFPFIVGIIAGEGEHPKIREYLKKTPYYEDQGGVSSPTCCAINIIPWRVYPSSSGQHIDRRLTIRERMFYDKLGRMEAQIRQSSN